MREDRRMRMYFTLFLPLSVVPANVFKKMRHACRALSWLIILSLASASLAWGADDNENSTPTGWWFYTGQTYAQVKNTVTKLHARIINIKTDVSSHTYTVTYVRNTGSYAKQWWWYVGIDAATLAQRLTTNGGRLITLQAYDIGGGDIRFAVAMVANTGADAKAWWYYYGQTARDIDTLTRVNNARLTTLESYVSNGQTRYAFIMISNTGADAKGWGYYYNTSPQTIADGISSGNYRLLDLTSAGNGNYNTAMVSCATGCPGWWWYYGVNPYGVLDKAQNTGARVLGADKYSGNCNGSSNCFATVMISNTPADITACDPSGCISESKLVTNISTTLAKNVVGYSVQVGGLAPKYGGLARTATDTSLAMEPDLVTNLASVSKTLTAIGILQLLAANGLNPDTPISPYIYSDWAQGPNINLLTFRHLLTHTSGFMQTASNCKNNGTGPNSGIDYAGLKQIVANGVPNPAYIGAPKYGNCNFALLRELMPALLHISVIGFPDFLRPFISSTLYINYINAHVFKPVSVPSSACKAPAGTNKILSYPYPPGTTAGTDWGDWSLTCGSGGWVLSAAHLFRVVSGLAIGQRLLTTTQRQQMFSGDLGWDSAVRTDCPDPYVCKNGDLNDGASRYLWTYAGVLMCNVPVVVVVNSPLPAFYQSGGGGDIIGVVKDALNASMVTGTPQACP
jgi:hypothetical protein